jgi:hypothetical protein
MDVAIIRQALYTQDEQHSGYGFINYSNDPAGVHCAILAVDALASVTLNGVSFICSHRRVSPRRCSDNNCMSRSMDRLSDFDCSQTQASHSTDSQDSNLLPRYAALQPNYLRINGPLNALPFGHSARPVMPPSQACHAAAEMQTAYHQSQQTAYQQSQQTAYPAPSLQYPQYAHQMPQQDMWYQQQQSEMFAHQQQQQQLQRQPSPELMQAHMQQVQYQQQMQQMQLAQEHQYQQAQLIQQQQQQMAAAQTHQQMMFYAESPHYHHHHQQQLNVVTPPSLSPSHASAGTNPYFVPTHVDPYQYPTHANRYYRA